MLTSGLLLFSSLLYGGYYGLLCAQETYLTKASSLILYYHNLLFTIGLLFFFICSLCISLMQVSYYVKK